jgi:putative transposase
VIRFIDVHQDRRSGTLRWGIEPIAKLLGIAPSTYHAARNRPPSARAVRDAELRPVIQRVYDENFVAYGGDKMWDHLNNVDGIRVARCALHGRTADEGDGLVGCASGPILDQDDDHR